ncbi:MAG: hypothetical protein ACNA8L_13470 [Luteolibacter sp.]
MRYTLPISNMCRARIIRCGFAYHSKQKSALRRKVLVAWFSLICLNLSTDAQAKLPDFADFPAASTHAGEINLDQVPAEFREQVLAADDASRFAGSAILVTRIFDDKTVGGGIHDRSNGTWSPLPRVRVLSSSEGLGITFRKDSSLLLIREDTGQGEHRVHALIWTPHGLQFLLTPWEEPSRYRDEVEDGDNADDDDISLFRYQRALARAINVEEREEMHSNIFFMAPRMGNYDLAVAHLLRYAQITTDRERFASNLEIMIGGWPDGVQSQVRRELSSPKNPGSSEDTFDSVGYVTRLKQALSPAAESSPGLRLMSIGSNYWKTQFLNGVFMGIRMNREIVSANLDENQELRLLMETPESGIVSRDAYLLNDGSIVVVNFFNGGSNCIHLTRDGRKNELKMPTIPVPHGEWLTGATNDGRVYFAATSFQGRDGVSHYYTFDGTRIEPLFMTLAGHRVMPTGIDGVMKTSFHREVPGMAGKPEHYAEHVMRDGKLVLIHELRSRISGAPDLVEAHGGDVFFLRHNPAAGARRAGMFLLRPEGEIEIASIDQPRANRVARSGRNVAWHTYVQSSDYPEQPCNHANGCDLLFFSQGGKPRIVHTHPRGRHEMGDVAVVGDAVLFFIGNSLHVFHDGEMERLKEFRSSGTIVHADPNRLVFLFDNNLSSYRF